jgi:hypothetical protein
MKDLGISRSTLLRSRGYLQTRGVIKFQSGKGSKATEYTMMGSVLLPALKTSRRYPLFRAHRYRQNDDTQPMSIKEILLKNQLNGKNFNLGK